MVRASSSWIILTVILQIQKHVYLVLDAGLVVEITDVLDLFDALDISQGDFCRLKFSVLEAGSG